MMEKVDVNGDDRHPLYDELTAVADAEGNAGDVVWNFEKFLIAPDGTVTRFRPLVDARRRGPRLGRRSRAAQLDRSDAKRGTPGGDGRPSFRSCGVGASLQLPRTILFIPS